MTTKDDVEDKTAGASVDTTAAAAGDGLADGPADVPAAWQPTPDHALPRASFVPRPDDANDPDFASFFAFTRTFLVPMLITKVFILYFGLNYARYPGEGYGYGLVISISVTLLSFVLFTWSNRRKKKLSSSTESSKLL